MSIEEYVQEELWDEKYWDTIQSLSRIAADIQNMRENPYATLNKNSDYTLPKQTCLKRGYQNSEDLE